MTTDDHRPDDHRPDDRRSDDRDNRPDGIRIGSISGSAVALGHHNTVTNTAAARPERDPAQEELLQAIRELRQDLARFVATPQTSSLDTELTETETEIEQTGRATRTRLTRLRTALTDANTVTGLLASGTTVTQAVAALL